MKKSSIKLSLVAEKSFPEYPSASAITALHGSLYIAGDDAPELLVLDMQLNEVSRIRLSEHAGTRIPKTIKPDYESIVTTSYGVKEVLMLIGSGSTPARETALAVFPAGDMKPDSINFSDFIRKLKPKIAEINIEGATSYRNKLLLANRSNLTNKLNQLIETDVDFYGNAKAPILVRTLRLPAGVSAGISDLTYDAEHDMLWFSASSEETTNAYDDGAIGDSFVGRISNFSKRSGDLEAVELLNLSSIFPQLKGEKIEGICINDGKLYAVSDNDNGQSKVFVFK